MRLIFSIYNRKNTLSLFFSSLGSFWLLLSLLFSAFLMTFMQEIWNRRLFVFVRIAIWFQMKDFDLNQVMLVFHREFISRIFENFVLAGNLSFYSNCAHRDICTVFFLKDLDAFENQHFCSLMVGCSPQTYKTQP